MTTRLVEPLWACRMRVAVGPRAFMALLADIWAPKNPNKGGSMITRNHGTRCMTPPSTFMCPPSPDGKICWTAIARMANPKTADTKFVRTHGPFRPRHTCPRAACAGASAPHG